MSIVTIGEDLLIEKLKADKTFYGLSEMKLLFLSRKFLHRLSATQTHRIWSEYDWEDPDLCSQFISRLVSWFEDNKARNIF